MVHGLQHIGKIVLIVALCLGCGRPPPRRTLYIFGDSISAGIYTTKNYGQLLGEHYGFAVVNLSVSGTVLLSYAQYGRIMPTSFVSGDIVLFTPGANDLRLYWPDPDYFGRYQSALHEIAVKICSQGAQLVLGTPLTQLPGSNIPFDGLAPLAALANSEGALFDGQNLFIPTAANMHDPVHPNDLGDQELANLYIKVIDKIISQTP